MKRKYHQTPADRADESRAMERHYREHAHKYRQTSEDRAHERRGMEKYHQKKSHTK